MLSTRAFAHSDLCNLILGPSGEGGTKVLFVSKHPLQLLTHSNDYLRRAFVISQLVRNIQVQ